MYLQGRTAEWRRTLAVLLSFTLALGGLTFGMPGHAAAAGVEGDAAGLTAAGGVYPGGLPGLQFSVEKFSAFTISNFNQQEKTGSHEAYIDGFPDGEFRPDEQVTRAQLALMLARNLGQDGNAGTGPAVPFEDVAEQHYAASAIAYVAAQGIMQGDPSGRFRADDAITRAEMATVMVNYLHLPLVTGASSGLTDADGHWAQAAIAAVVADGAAHGYPDGSFRPNGKLTRAEAVRLINYMFERGPLLGAMTPAFPDVSETHWAYGHIQEAAIDHAYRVDEDGKEQRID